MQRCGKHLDTLWGHSLDTLQGHSLSSTALKRGAPASWRHGMVKWEQRTELLSRARSPSVRTPLFNKGQRRGARTLSPTFPPALPELQKTYSSWKQTPNAG